ncbi:hypothetical protein [Bacillus sp. SD088]|uniref:hypothetical protein n=1 Tax=Bacillus sp. SD088 TaxID=2782012 RepID=UPI001A95B87E|nr:hypothetical protein [Bacillus sp. SD088]MBO0992345.1 hypothetical protein [Bacillus sp. SD088]
MEIMRLQPTGNLDSKAAKSLMDSLQQLNQEQSRTILMVTHDPFAASYCKRVVFIRDGKPYTEIYHSGQRQAFFQKILDVLSLMGGHEDDLPPTSI